VPVDDGRQVALERRRSEAALDEGGEETQDGGRASGQGGPVVGRAKGFELRPMPAVLVGGGRSEGARQERDASAGAGRPRADGGHGGIGGKPAPACRVGGVPPRQINRATIRQGGDVGEVAQGPRE